MMIQPGSIQPEYIEGWLHQQLEQAQAEGLVFEITGGAYSAVVAALAKNAAHDKALAAILPCHSSPQDLVDAELVAKLLGLQPARINLDPVFEALREQLPEAPFHVLEQLKARLRMNALFTLAGIRNCLVVGSLCRTDWQIGRFTKFGDGAADLQPLFHLLHRDIRAMAVKLGLPDRITGKEPTLPSPLEPTDHPAPSFTYAQIDAFLADEGHTLPGPIQTGIREAVSRAEVRRSPPKSISAAPASSPIDYDKSIEALTLISKAITSDQYVEDILRLIVMVTAEVMGSSVCSLWLLDEKERVLRLRATQSINKDYLKERVLHLGEGVVGRVVQENHPVSILDVLTDQHFKEKELAQKMGLVSMLSMPMRVKDRVIGVINCYTSHPHEFSELQMNILTTVANQAAVAIENTELMVQTKVIEEELAARKIVERAKDLIVDRLRLSGEEAYRWLQKRSMDTRKSMREVAEAVLLTMGN